MTKRFECKKAENCFSESQTYEYRMACKVSESFLVDLGALGTLSCKRNFRRPFFVLDLPDQTHVKGVIGGDIIKASFTADNFARSKADFEMMLERLIAVHEGGDHDGPKNA